jgi:hypothetical protein
MIFRILRSAFLALRINYFYYLWIMRHTILHIRPTGSAYNYFNESPSFSGSIKDYRT